MKSCIRRSAGSLRIYRARNKRTGDAVVRYYVLERVNGSQKWIHITEWNLRSNREVGCSVIFQTIKHRYRAPCCFFLLSLFRLVIADIQYVRLFSRSIDLGPRFWSPSRKSSRLERHRAISRTCAFSSPVFFLFLFFFFVVLQKPCSIRYRENSSSNARRVSPKSEIERRSSISLPKWHGIETHAAIGKNKWIVERFSSSLVSELIRSI